MSASPSRGPLCGWLVLGIVWFAAWACSGGADNAVPADVAADETGFSSEAGDGLPEVPGETPLPEPASAEEVMAAGPFGVGVLVVELVDTSRVTPANGDQPEKPARTLPTHVWYPTSTPDQGPPVPVEAAPSADGGPWPLIIYCHGFSSKFDENLEIVALLATRGFVVVSADFPLTGLSAPGGPNAADVVNQPGDVSFLIDTVLDWGQEADHPLYRRVDPYRIGVAGVSLGAMTTVIAAFHPEMGDPRIKAAVAAAVPGCYLKKDFFKTRSVPLLLVHGTGDAIISYAENGLPAFEHAMPPKYFLSLKGGTHTLMAGLAKPLATLLGNTDDIGCDSLAGNESVSPEALARMSEEFGGLDYEDALAHCPAPCMAPAADSPMDGLLQLELLQKSMIAFFVARLVPDLRYEAFLRTELTRQIPGATLTFEAGSELP